MAVKGALVALVALAVLVLVARRDLADHQAALANRLSAGRPSGSAVHRALVARSDSAVRPRGLAGRLQDDFRRRLAQAASQPT